MIFVVYIICLVAIVYLMLIRPQQKRKKALKVLVESLKDGSCILTVGGLHGTVKEVKEQTVVLETFDGSLLEFEKVAIAKVFD